MMIKNKRIIINENHINEDIELLQNYLKNFFKSDIRFTDQDIAVIVDFDDECWSENTCGIWCELDITITNFDKVIELGGELQGEKKFASAYIGFTTESYEPTFVMNDGNPEFYYVFSWAQSGVTNFVTWENNQGNETIEDIVMKELEKLEV